MPISAVLLGLCLVPALAAAQQPTEDAAPRLTALEYTDATLFAAKPSVSPEIRGYLEKIAIFSAIVYSADEVAPGTIEDRYALTAEDKWMDNRTAAKQMMLAKVAGLDRQLKQRCAEYLRQYPYWGTVYHAYVLESFRSAPNFGAIWRFYSLPGKESGNAAGERIRNVTNQFSALMRSMYGAGGGKSGWRPMVDMLAKYQLKPELLNTIEKRLYDYVRMEKPKGLTFSVIYNPLMGAGTATNAFPTHDPYKIVFIAGPWPNAGKLKTNISHEMMHPIVNHIRRNSAPYRLAVKRTEAVNNTIRGERWGYNSWNSYFAEATIQCVSSRIEGSSQSPMQYKDFITAQLSSYEASDESFEQFLMRLLDALQKHAENASRVRQR